MSIAVASRVPTLENAKAAAEACGEVEENVEEVLVFGSVASGNADASSDIDLLVLVSEDLNGQEYRLTYLFSKEARAAAGVYCDVTVRTVCQWEHLTTNVLSSFEAAIKPEALRLFYRKPTKQRTRLGNLTGVSKDDMDEAAKHGRMAAKELDRLSTAISALYEGKMPRDPSEQVNPDQLRVNRLQDVMNHSHNVLEMSIRSIGASISRTSFASDHDILAMVPQMLGNVPEAPNLRAAIYKILDPICLSDGTVRNWHIDMYTGEREGWLRDSTDENARAHTHAALGLAQVTANQLENRSSVSPDPADAAHLIRVWVNEINEHPYIDQELDRSPPAIRPTLEMD